MKVSAGSRGRVLNPPCWEECLGQCQANVGSEKGWGPPVDGSLPGDLASPTWRSVRAGGAGSFQSGGCAG